MAKLTDSQKTSIRLSLFEDIKDANLRSKIMTIALSYGDETDDEDAVDKMAYFLLKNPDRIEEMYKEFAGYFPEGATESKNPKKD